MRSMSGDLHDPNPTKRPRGKGREKLGTQLKAMRRLWNLLYRSVRRQAVQVDRLNMQMSELQIQRIALTVAANHRMDELLARVEKLESDVRIAHNLAVGALAVQKGTDDGPTAG